MNTGMENDDVPSNQIVSSKNSLLAENKSSERFQPHKDLTSEKSEEPSHSASLILVMEGCPQSTQEEGQQCNANNNSSTRPSSAISSSALTPVDSAEEFHDARDESEPEDTLNPPPRFQAQAEFRIEALRYHLNSCMQNPRGEIDLNCYLDAYQEICKLLENFGTVVRTIIGKDIKNKIAIMKRHQTGFHGSFYQTVDSMVTFEKVMKLCKKNPDDNGSKTVLNLHRSLNFVAQFLRILNESDLDHGVGSIAREAYFNTLAKFHPSGYKVVARAAFTNLGNKGQLIANFHDGSMPYARLTELISEVVKAATEVHARCQAIFTRHNFLDMA